MLAALLPLLASNSHGSGTVEIDSSWRYSLTLYSMQPFQFLKQPKPTTPRPYEYHLLNDITAVYSGIGSMGEHQTTLWS